MKIVIKAVKSIFNSISVVIVAIALVFAFAPTKAFVARDGSDDIYGIDMKSSEFQIIYALTRGYYENVTGDTPPFSSGWGLYIVRGETAKKLSEECSCLGQTIPSLHVMYLLDVPYSEWRLVLSHELVHVLQTNSGRIEQLPGIYVEYEAEVISRSVYIRIMDSISRDVEKISVPIGIMEKARFIGSIAAVKNEDQTGK